MAFGRARRFRVSVQVLATVALLGGLAKAQASPNVAPQGSGFSPEEKSAFSYLILPEVSGPALKSPVKFLAEFTAPLQFPLALNGSIECSPNCCAALMIDKRKSPFSRRYSHPKRNVARFAADRLNFVCLFDRPISIANVFFRFSPPPSFSILFYFSGKLCLVDLTQINFQFNCLRTA